MNTKPATLNLCPIACSALSIELSYQHNQETKRVILWKSTEKLLKLFECLHDPQFIQSHKSNLAKPNAFSRQRQLPFHLLVFFFLNQVKGALQRELDAYFEQALHGAQSVSSAALCKARTALAPSVFLDLNQRFIPMALQNTHGLQFHDLRVLAIDGSTQNLPRRTTFFDHFGGQVQNNIPLPIARISQIIDVGTGISLEALLTPYALGETTLATHHLRRLPERSVTLYDRGYFSAFLCFCHRQHQRDFVIRMPRGNVAAADALFGDPKAPKKFELVAGQAGKSLIQEVTKQGYPVNNDPMPLRLVRVLLSTGEIEVLLTSLLDDERYPDADFAELYNSRWTIETDFRSLKSRLQIENYTGRRPISVEQDFYAKVLTKNLVQFLTAIEQERMDRERQAAMEHQQPHTKHRAKINFVDALNVTKFALIHAILFRSVEAINDIGRRISRYYHFERKGRSFPRKHTKSKIPRFPMAYKQTA